MKQSFFARRYFVILMVTVFMLPLIWAGTRRALESNTNDIKDWLPDDYPETKTHQWFQAHFPHEQFVLVSWAGKTADDPGCVLGDPRLEAFARKIESFDPNLVELGIKSRGIRKALVAQNLHTRKLIREFQRNSSLDDVEGLSQAEAALVRATVHDWQSPFKAEVLTGDRLVDQLQERESNRAKVIHRLRGSLIGFDGQKTCMVVTLTGAAKGKKLRPTLETIRRIAHDDIGIDEKTQLRLGGPPVDNVAITVEGERTLFRLAALSAIVGLGISWVCFRSFRLTFLIFSIAILSAGMGLASVFYSGNTVDAILLSMPSLVYVLAMSGTIHIVNYYHDAVRSKGLDGAAEEAVRLGWLPCTLAAITTSLGLGSLLASQLIPISKFGIYSAWGVLATLSLLFLFLPACLHRFPSRDYVKGGLKNPSGQHEPSIIDRFWQAVGGLVVRHNMAVMFGCLLAMAFFAAGLGRIETQVKLMKLFSDGTEILDHYAWLEEHLGPLVPMEVVVRINEECDLNMLQRVRLVHDVEQAIESEWEGVGALSAATFTPGIGATPNRAKVRLSSYTGGFWNPDRAALTLLKRSEGDLRKAGYLSRDGDEELWRVSARAPALGDVDYSVFIHDLRATVEKVLDDRYRVLSEADRADGAVPAEGISVTYTGVVPLVYKAQHELMNGLYESLLWAFGLIAVVMVLVLRSPAAGLLSMIPNLFPVVMVFGAMGWLGVIIDVGTMMTASVALGVAVDDTIHFLTWFRRGLDRGRDRKGAVMLAYERCGTAMTQTTLIGGLGLSVFAFSTFTPTERFGVLMLTLLSAALAGDLIFLPAVLSGPVGFFFRTSNTEPKDGPGQDTGTSGATAQVEGEVPREPSIRPYRRPGAPPPSGGTRASRVRPSIRRHIKRRDQGHGSRRHGDSRDNNG